MERRQFKDEKENMAIIKYGHEQSAGGIVISEAMTLTAKNLTTTVNNVVNNLIDGRMCVIGHEGNDSSYVVEGVIDGYIVVEIEESIFDNNTDLISIDRLDTIGIIGKRAFVNCTNLKSMP